MLGNATCLFAVTFNGFNSSKSVKNLTVISDYGIYPSCVHPLIKNKVLYCIALCLYSAYDKFEEK